MSFNRKIIRITLTLNENDESGERKTFTTDGKNKLSASGLRVNAEVTYGNGSITPYAIIRVYGLPVETMNKLIRIKWDQVKSLRNTVQIDAGDDGTELSTVFRGGITLAYPDFSSAPDVSLVMESQTAVFELKKVIPAESYKGGADVGLIIGDICKRIGYTFTNFGVAVTLTDVYLCGGAIERIIKVCNDAGVNYYIEQGAVSITPKDQPRKIKIPVITPTSGLIGYPAPDQRGVKFLCLYDPLVRFGGIVRIKDSLIERCNADWRVYGVNITLETEQDAGRWFMEVSAAKRGEDYAHVK